MSLKLIDDATGLVLDKGRYYRVSIMGDDEISIGDFADFGDVIIFIQAYCIGKAQPPITIQTIYFDEYGRQGYTAMGGGGNGNQM